MLPLSGGVAARDLVHVLDIVPTTHVEQLDEQGAVVTDRMAQVLRRGFAAFARLAMPYAVRYFSTSSGCSTEMSAARCSNSSTG